jgi:hypothetical protein
MAEIKRGADMRHIYAVLLLLMFVSPSVAQEALTVGNSYSGHVKLSSSNSGLYLALPPGAWVLTSLEEARGIAQNSPMLSGALVSINDQNRITGVVSFTAGNDSVGGWAKVDYCSRKDTFFLSAQAQRHGREMRCWGVQPTALSVPSANAAKYVRDSYQWVAKNGLEVPPTMIAVDIYRSNGAKYLHATYFRNPEIEGFPRSTTNPWQKDVVVGDPKRLSYMQAAKEWGEQWQPTFDAALAGRPK